MGTVKGREGEDSNGGTETEVQRGLEGIHRAEVVVEFLDVGVEAARVGAQCLGDFVTDEADQGDLQGAEPSTA